MRLVPILSSVHPITEMERISRITLLNIRAIEPSRTERSLDSLEITDSITKFKLIILRVRQKSVITPPDKIFLLRKLNILA
jgi:hypothetical protein